MPEIQQIRCKSCQTVLGCTLDQTFIFELANKKTVLLKASDYHNTVFRIRCSNCKFEDYIELKKEGK